MIKTIRKGARVQSGTIGRYIDHVGEVLVTPASEFACEAHIFPVHFANEGYGVVCVWYDTEAGGTKLAEWVPNRPPAAEAISGLKHMPAVEHGLMPGVVRVHGEDASGKFIVKLFYGEAKNLEGRLDECFRL